MRRGRERVVLVDDDTEYLRVAKRLLQRRRPELVIDVFDRAEAAVEDILHYGADLVMLDIEMPDLDGIVACRVLKSMRRARTVVLVSGKVTAERRLAGLRAGADEIVQKPCDLEPLIDRATNSRRTGTSAMLSTQQIDIARNISRALKRRYGTLMSVDDIDGFALLGLCEAAERYNAGSDGPFVAFAMRRIRGSVLDELRRLRFGRDERAQAHALDVVPSAEPLPDVVAENHEIIEQLATARATLTPVAAQLVCLRFEAGLSIPAIAKQLGLTTARTTHMLSQSIERLKRMLTDQPMRPRDYEPATRER